MRLYYHIEETFGDFMKKLDENFFLKDLSDEIKNEVLNGNIEIILELYEECDIDEDKLKLLEQNLNKYSIPLKNFTFIHDCFDLPDSEYEKKYNKTHLYRKANQTIEYLKSGVLSNPEIFNKKYKFHFPIRRCKKHRMKLLDKLFLHDENFIENNLVSYDIDAIENPNIWGDHKEKYSDKFVKYIERTRHKYIDSKNYENMGGYSCETKETYDSSYITIVTETYFEQPYNYISEKVYRPIMQCHPFIFMGRPKTLKVLKNEFGFRTFSPLIDESYDEELDDTKRFEMIYQEILRLNNMSFEQLNSFVYDLKDILIHNQNQILSFSKDNKIQ